MSLRGPRMYTVYRKPGTSLEKVPPVFVREGFNWAAFLLTLLWALYQRLWLVAAALTGIQLAVMGLQEAGLLSEEAGFVLMLGVQLLFGFHANDFLRRKLARRGYVLAGLVSGESKFRAERRFFEQALASA